MAAVCGSPQVPCGPPGARLRPQETLHESAALGFQHPRGMLKQGPGAPAGGTSLGEGRRGGALRGSGWGRGSGATPPPGEAVLLPPDG